MFRSTLLSPSHWAGAWVVPDEDQRNDLYRVNQLGYEYACAADSPEKEARLLHILEQFHGYLMKYVVMIVRGTMPDLNTRGGKDARELLRQLAPRAGGEGKAASYDATCKMLHLAFKGTTTEEIYDTLAFCFMKAARKYDPHYASKTRQVCEELNGLQQKFTQGELEDRVGFDCTGILRSLVRKKYLASIIGKKKVVGYQRGPNWPAPASFFESGPIGFVYVLQIWFRYYLNECIVQQMAELESRDGVLQLLGSRANGFAVDNSHSFQVADGRDVLIPVADGNCVSDHGNIRFMADRTLMDMPLDVSAMTLDWASETTAKG